jgi:hypothetical protein
MDTGETVIVDESAGPFFMKKSRRVPNNTTRRMETPDTYVVDKRGRLWRPKNAEGEKLDFSREGGSRSLLPMAMYDATAIDLNKKNILYDMFMGTIKTNGDIFLLGEPTNNITMLIMKLYHENMVRIHKYKPIEITKIGDIFMFMTGMLELNGTGDIYVTISETETEGIDYDKKFHTFYSLLKNSGCNVKHGEGEDFDFGTPTQWKSPGENDFDEIFFNEIKGSIFIDETNKFNYSSIIKNYPINVKLIQSTKYIENRKKGTSFVPFKRLDVKNNIRCVNGSLCVESKLFGFIYDLGYKFNDVSGYIAYWVGNKVPPNHYYKPYSYTKRDPKNPNNSKEEEKLRKMFTTTFGKLNEDTKLRLTNACNNTLHQLDTSINGVSLDGEDHCIDIFELAIEPMALTCPGCYMNFQLYVNNIQGKWDNSDCNKVNAGGRRRTKNKKLNKETKNSRKTTKKK